MSQLKDTEHLKISFGDIVAGTKNFEYFIGKGGYGKVFKGELVISGKPTLVAVKRLNKLLGQGLKEFLTEIQFLSVLKHPNLISLLGYCDEGDEKIIIYEYAERGSLDRYLKIRDTPHILTWFERLKICVDAARGLDYLHNHVGNNRAIIHRDIKSANILIDKNWSTKVSDLGLSKLGCLTCLNISEVVSHACGTHGYCEPEYAETNIVMRECDVYSFGMVLFEVLCGRLCSNKEDVGFLLTCQSAKEKYEKNKLEEIIDPRLNGQISLKSMKEFATIAYNCLHDDRRQRPSMSQVVKLLEDLLKFQALNNERNPEIDDQVVLIPRKRKWSEFSALRLYLLLLMALMWPWVIHYFLNLEPEYLLVHLRQAFCKSFCNSFCKSKSYKMFFAILNLWGLCSGFCWTFC